MTDPVNHPAHYTEHPSGIECIQITEHMGFNLGNAVKYIWRADLKGSAIEDLEKARWYIDRELTKRDALFPATEPAEKCLSRWDELRCDLNAGHIGSHERGILGDPDYASWTDDVATPAPAEPAEEETKAEDYCCHPKCRWSDWGGINRKHERGADCPIVPKPTSSPVVPTPTETEWQTWQEVPDDTPYRGTTENGLRTETIWVNKSGARHLHRPSLYVIRFGDYADHEMHNFAPFVAAKEG